jgi:hypothetical protein
MIDLELIISAQELRDKLNITNGIDGLPGTNGSPDTAEDIRNKLESLEGNERIDKSAIKGLDDELSRVSTRFNAGGGLARGVADRLYTPITGFSKVLTYNTDGTLNSVSDSSGTKTMIWSNGILTGYTGTQLYRNKTFTYTNGALTAVTVS